MIITLERLSVFVEVFWKSGVVLGAAMGVNALLHKRSADMRRLVLSTTIVVMLVAVLACPVLPRWTAVTPMWLRLGDPAAAQTEVPESATGDSRAGLAAPVIQMTRTELPSRSERWARISNQTPDVIPLIWFVCTASFLARLVNSLLGLRRLRYASDAVSDAGCRVHLYDATARLGPARLRNVTLLQNDSIAAPVTWGIIRPVILVPAGFERLPSECREAVLYHELAHIQGYDFLLRGLAEIARALIWFQPLIWIVRRQLREEQELAACDNRVLAAGGKPSAYARLLLEWDLRPGMDASIAVGMAHRSCLKRRLYALLAQDLRRDRVARAGILVTWFLGLAITLPLAAMNLASAIPGQPTVGHSAVLAPVRRGPVAAIDPSLVVQAERFPAVPPGKSAGIPAPEKRVQLAQALGAPVPEPGPAPQAAASDARPVSTPLPRFSSWTSLVVEEAVVTDQNGKEIEGLAASDFVLTEDGRQQPIIIFEFQKADRTTQGISSYYVLGYYTINGSADGAYRKIAIALKGDTTAKLDFRAGYYAQKGFIQPDGTVKASDGDLGSNVGAHFTVDGANDVDTGSKATFARVILKVDPEYSDQARKAKYSGTVSLLVDIGATGQVTSAAVIRSVGMGLDEKAVQAVTRWRFRPGTKDGKPVATQVLVDLGFRLL